MKKPFEGSSAFRRRLRTPPSGLRVGGPSAKTKNHRRAGGNGATATALTTAREPRGALVPFMWQNYGICDATPERNAPWRSQGGAFLCEKKHHSARYAYRMALSRQNLASSSPSSASSSSKQPSDALACSPPRSLVVHMHCTLYTGVWLNLGRCMCARRHNHTPVVNSSSPFYRRGRVHAREMQGSASHDHRTPASVPAAHRRAPTTHAPPRAVPPRRKRPAARAPLTNQPFHRSLPAATTLERLCCAMKRCSGVQYLMIHSTRKHKLRIQKRWSGAQYLGGQPFTTASHVGGVTFIPGGEGGHQRMPRLLPGREWSHQRLPWMQPRHACVALPPSPQSALDEARRRT